MKTKPLLLSRKAESKSSLTVIIIVPHIYRKVKEKNSSELCGMLADERLHSCITIKLLVEQTRESREILSHCFPRNIKRASQTDKQQNVDSPKGWGKTWKLKCPTPGEGIENGLQTIL
jgi:hypothetical protein